MNTRSPLRGFAVTALMTLTGCVLGPYDLDEIGATSARTFSGYAEHASSTIVISAFRYSTGTWVPIATAVSSASPDVPAGVWAGNPNLYAWSVQASIATAADPAGHCFLDASCTPRIGTPGSSTIRLQFVEQGSSLSNLVVQDEHWNGCMAARIARGEDFSSAAYNCRAPSHPELRLRLIEDWVSLPTSAPTGDMALISTGDEQIAAGSDGTHVRYSRAATPAVWSSWTTIPGGPTAGFPTDWAPVSVSEPDGVSMALYAIGNDELIHRTPYDRTTHTYGAMVALPGITRARGRLSGLFRWTTPRATVLAYSSGANQISVSRFSGTTLLDTGTFVGSEAVLSEQNHTSEDVAILAVRDGTNIRVWKFMTPTAPTFGGTIAVGEIEGMSPVLGGSDHHLFVARRTPHGYGEIVHYMFPEFGPAGGVGWGVREEVVATYPLGASPLRLAASVDRSGLPVATWREGATGLKAVVWSPGEGGAWRVFDVGTTATLAGSPTLAEAYWPATGSHLGALAVGTDGRPRFMDLGKALLRQEVERYFDVYTTGATWGCGSLTKVPDPVWREDLASFQVPRQMTLRSTRKVPRPFADRLFRSVAARECSAGPSQPATLHRACDLAKYPIVFSGAAQAYTCPDGVYFGSNAPFNDVELLRVVARGLGFTNDGAAPGQWHVDASGISLAALTEGAAIFGSSLGIPPPFLESRAPGFVGREPVELNTREGAFATALDFYARGGGRWEAARDLTRTPCNDLLARKYDWIKTHVFSGYEPGNAFGALPPLGRCP